MKTLKYRGRPNRRARKRARVIWDPAPGGGKSTKLFSRRHDPERRELCRVGALVLQKMGEVETERPIAARSRNMMGQMNYREALADLSEAATLYLELLNRGRRRSAGLPPDRLKEEIERAVRWSRAIDVSDVARPYRPARAPKLLEGDWAVNTGENPTFTRSGIRVPSNPALRRKDKL